MQWRAVSAPLSKLFWGVRTESFPGGLQEAEIFMGMLRESRSKSKGERGGSQRDSVEERFERLR
jgi:hypothetical protein